MKHIAFGLMVQKLWGFKDLSRNSGMLLAIANAAKCAQIRPKLPKSAWRQLAWGTLKCHQNLRSYCFSKIKISICKRVTRACFHHSDFLSKKLSYAIFIVKKQPFFSVWISAYPLVEIDDFLKVLHLVWAWDFVDMYLTHLGIRIQRGSFQIYLKKWFFGPQKTAVPLGQGKKNFFFNFECYDVANGKEWKCKIW
jgi:hypothetical protein